jgi:hypothetical protein
MKRFLIQILILLAALVSVSGQVPRRIFSDQTATSGSYTPPTSPFNEAFWAPLENNYEDSTDVHDDLMVTGSVSFVTSPSPPFGSYWISVLSGTTAYLTTDPDIFASATGFTAILFYFTNVDNATAELFIGPAGSTSSGILIRENVSGQDLDFFIGGTEYNATNYYGASPTTGVLKWFAFTYESSTGEWAIYFNGALESSGTADTGVNFDGSWTIMEGAAGYTKDIRLFDSALSAAEITALYNNLPDAQ